jgi:DNA-binding MarR family transcriptional regulator
MKTTILHDTAESILDIFPAFHQKFDLELRCTGRRMAPAHFRLLGALSIRKHTLGELAEMQSVSTLVERGWVARETDDQDRRVVWLSLTPEGYKLLGEIQMIIVNRIVGQLSVLTDNELFELTAGMQILHRVLDGIRPSIETTNDMRNLR